MLLFRNLSFFILLIIGFETGCAFANSFTVFDNSSSEIPYRIPAIAQTKNGDIIAVADYRHSKADIGMAKDGKVDLRYRIKSAGSGEWGKTISLACADSIDGNFVAFGDPCIVADKESDNIMVTSCFGNVSFPKGTHDNHQGWARFISEDGGKTWSDFEDISPQVFDILDHRSDGPIRAFFIGSGKISQSNTIKTDEYYRLYCAALVKTNEGKNVNYVLFSDDFGKNWRILGNVEDCPVPEGGDEPKADELPDGRVLISSRTKGGRIFNIFSYDNIEKGEGQWDIPSFSSIENNGVIASSNACNGEILIVPVIRKSDGAETRLLLQSVPLNSEGQRANVGINYKDLGKLPELFSSSQIATEWDGVVEVSPNTSAYSTMVIENNGTIAFLFEENQYNGGYDIVYRNLSIEEITDGDYSFKLEL